MTERLMVETSALVAIVLEEPGWRRIAEQVAHTSAAFTTCFNVFEAALAVVRERRLKASEAYEIVLAVSLRLGIEVRDYGGDAIPQAVLAREKFGSGAHGLNMGDCLSYGAAKRDRARLLYVGDDFARTDVNDAV